MRHVFFILGIAISGAVSCVNAKAQEVRAGTDIQEVRSALTGAKIPESMRGKILQEAESGEFLSALSVIVSGDPFLWRLIDKTHPLPEGYEPADLVPLKNGSYRIGREGLSLRREAERALAEMASASQKAGAVLTASSTYRSYAYQKTVYERNVREMGREAADRESARPGVSQHQSGLVVDFGSITDDFAKTAAGKWLVQNASAYGWSISFPDGYEALTGYRWESWHYRYVGEALAAFIDNYFGGIQQYALQFIHAYNNGGVL